ncbi:four helix bundle suffix domain-containing protein [uncultured Muribaculum sp.]|uniref:four helix bundle suffix domain-containing protein n=1 Tax=uncultured Muribaculum sp. TaxID=1918613 RepID=UPI0025E09706|nr:four helix bundle suffix domain-containing protein [uncultured Muribaculum sp.]
MPSSTFLRQRSDYRNLLVYRKCECIYDLTYYFINKFIAKGDRTADQMLQAARSGKQNIAEGSAASVTSRETEIKLTNVAKASLKELLEDYIDYLRTRSLPLWQPGDPKFEQARRVCSAHSDSAYYREAAATRSDSAIANITVILLNQTDYLLFRLIESQKKAFLAQGGIREEMTRARLAHRNLHK